MSVILESSDVLPADMAAEANAAGPGHAFRFLKKLASFVIVGSAFLIGLFSIFAWADHQTKIENLAKVVDTKTTISNRLLKIEDELSKTQSEQAESQKAQEKITTRLAAVEGAVMAQTQAAERVADEMDSRLAASDTRFAGLEQQVSQLQLRLNGFEDHQPVGPSDTKEISGENAVAKSSEPAAAGKPGARLSRYSIVRLEGKAAWIAAPEGWFHVAVGEKLPGGAKVLDVSRQNRRAAVLTDKGFITSGR